MLCVCYVSLSWAFVLVVTNEILVLRNEVMSIDIRCVQYVCVLRERTRTRTHTTFVHHRPLQWTWSVDCLMGLHLAFAPAQSNTNGGPKGSHQAAQCAIRFVLGTHILPLTKKKKIRPLRLLHLL